MRILIAEDEGKVASAIAVALASAGFVPDTVHNGEDAWFKGSTEDYAAIVLDLGLPGLDGLSVLRRWRAESVATPVVVLSARGSWSERVDGIDSGADDYLPKPFEMEELLARVRAVLRRSGGLSSSVIAIGQLRLDLNAGLVTFEGQRIELTPLERTGQQGGTF
jgi:two-component system OmpR family response regulator